MFPMTLEVLWHPPLLAHKALPGTHALLSTAPVTRLSHRLINWTVLFQETEGIKSAAHPPPLSFSGGIALRHLDIRGSYLTATLAWCDRGIRGGRVLKMPTEQECQAGNCH